MASKSTGTKTAAKKRAPAKKTAPVQKAVREPEPAVASAAKQEPDVEPVADGEAAIIKELQSGDMVRFYVPRDPSSGDEQFFERSINGHIIRLRAGEVRTLPLWLVEFIEERISIQRLSERSYDDFKTKNGKLLQ